MSEEIAYFTVSAFASMPQDGNPAVVVLLNKDCTDETMQKIAKDFQVSETAFLKPKSGSQADPWKTSEAFLLRWFTPCTEVPLCGHATLSSAFVLFKCKGNSTSELTFKTSSGDLHATQAEGLVSIDLPTNAPRLLTDVQKKICSPMVQYVSRWLSVKEVEISTETEVLLLRVEDKYTRTDFEDLCLDPKELLKLHDGSLFQGLIVTLKGDLDSGSKGRRLESYDFVSRFFDPWTFENEDPVTGAAHTVLGPFWKSILGKNSFKCRQCSRRGGDLIVNINNDSRVILSGQCVLTGQNYLKI